MIYVATAYWCDEHWVIAAGHNKDAVVRDANAYMASHPGTTGRCCAESYVVEEVEESR